jgi:drug/metabolite transporter (DMT)-like permease
VSYGISVALYLASLRRLPTATTGALFGVAPFVGVLVAWGVLGERPGPWFAVAAATAAVGVVLLARPGAPADPRRTPSAPAGSA